MASNSCEMYPYVGREPSTMYKELLKITKNRPLTNLIYAAYLQQGVAAQMDSQGYVQNKQGQHSAKDVYAFFDVGTIMNESISSSISSIARQIGAMDALGNPVDFTNTNDALNVAAQLNNSKKGAVAFVTQHGNKFNVIVEGRDSRTQIRANYVKEAQQVWDVLTQTFNSIGVDLNTFDSEQVNAIRGKDFVQWLNNIGVIRNSLIPQREIKTLLQINEGSQQVTRLKQMFGSLDETAKRIYEGYRIPGSVTASQMLLIESTLNNCKQLQGIDVAALSQQIAQIEQSMTTTPEASIQDTLKTLNQKYNLDFNEVHIIGDNINSLSRAAAEAAVTLQRQLKQLKSQEGVTTRTLSLERSLHTLMREINSNKYYAGVLGFLGEAANQISYMENLLNNLPQSGTNLERAAEMSRTLMEIKNISSGYKNIISALTKIDSLVSEEIISDSDKANITNQAKQLMEFFDKYEKVIRDLREETMINIAQEFLGDKLSNGMPIVNLVTMAEADSSIYDYLYSVGRVSNPLIATMGTIIRDAQSSRDAKMNDISLRIKRAENTLRKAGHNTQFMYEDSGYIISDIDWVAYNKAKAKARKAARMQGKKGLSLDEAMQNWEEANTEDRIVDYTNGRTEKVPNAAFRKAFPSLTQAQMDYYNEMMQIKGELGSLLPNYAQRQYMPPQIRRSFIDAMGATMKSGDLKGMVRAIKNKMADMFTIREDDELYARNGVIEGEDYGIVSGAMDNTPYRQIPIFYVNRLEDQRELLKDFSGALQHLAGTAINYEAMNNIKDMVEFMGDFIKKQNIAASKGNVKQADSVVDSGVRVFKDLVGFASNSNTAGVIDGFIDQHIYGVKLKGYSRWNKLLRSLLAYTSLRSLAVNVKGAISNYLVGELQMMIESGAMEFYNPVDYVWAHGKIFGDNTVGSVGRIMDFMTNNVNSKSVLLAQRFDPLNENFSEQSHARYYRGPLRHLLGKDFSFIGYGMGEHMIHFVNMYAVLHNTKVRVDGKNKSLYDIFSVGNKIDGNSELLFDQNATYINDEGIEVPVDDAFLDKVRDKIRYVNQTTHGSMNEEDKGLIHQHMLGRFVMNLRQWMVEHYSRRFRSSHFDASLKGEREGFYRTVGKFMYAWAGDIFNFEREAMLHWKDMNNMQKANVRRALSEQLVLGMLLGLSFALGEPEDHKKEFWTRMWIYQVKRAIVDVNGSTPWGIPTEMNTLINSPIAATNTVNALMYPFTGLGDIDDTIKSGKHKGENRYLRNLEKYWLPFYRQIEQLKDMDEDEGVFSVFDKNNMR